MNFRPAIQIKTAIRAMRDVVIPAMDGMNRQAAEQAGLVVAMLQLLERTLPLSYRYDCDELQRSVALARELRALGGAEPALAALSDRIAAAATAAGNTLDRTLADPTELESACRDMRAEISAFVTAAYRDAPAATKQAVARATLDSYREQLLRERAWVISQGWESEPEKLQPIEAMI